MPEPAPNLSASKWRDGRLWSWLVLAGIILFVVGVRFRLRDMPLERDEGEYAYMGQLMLEGVAPWKGAYTMKYPGTAAVYGLLMIFLGQSCAGVHLGLLVVNVATIVLMFLLARNLIGLTAACVAAATYGLMSLSGDALGPAGHATHFVVLTAVGGCLLLWRHSGSGTPGCAFGSGFLLGLSLLMKQNGMLFLAFGSVWLLWIGWSKALWRKRPFLLSALAFALGAILPFAVMLLLLWSAGVLQKFWFWTVDYVRAYSVPNPGLEIIRRELMQRMPLDEHQAFRTSLFGLVAMWLKRDLRPAALFATGLFVCSVIAVMPGLHFRPHYFVVLMPAVALLSGAAVQRAGELLQQAWRMMPLSGHAFSCLVAALPIVAFGAIFVKDVAREGDLFFKLTPAQTSRFLYQLEFFPDFIKVGNYLREHSAADARIAVLGSEPEIYFYAHRRPATGYIYGYPLFERQPYAQRMRQEMRDEIAAARPEFIVQVRWWTSWRAHPGSPSSIKEVCNELTPPGYELVASGDVLAKQGRVEWRWEGAQSSTNEANYVMIFRRKD